MLGKAKKEQRQRRSRSFYSETLGILKEIEKKTPIYARKQRSKLYMNRARGRVEAGILAIEQIFQIHKISHEGRPRLFPSQGPKLCCISETIGDPRSWRLELVVLSRNINKY